MPHPPYRIGYGHDLHRLQPGGRLILAGVVVAEDLSPIAHSDGDVVLHALTDALLGAIAAGDIGDAFPNTEERWKNADSALFVTHALRLVRGKGYRIANVDVLILAERPKLKPFKPAMNARLAALLDLAPDAVNIKAGTNEGVDAIGQGQAIAATVVVLLMA